MSLRRYAPLSPSRGIVIPPELRLEILRADGGCVAARIGDYSECMGGLELDHVRASGALGKKSATERGNLVSLCASHHRTKTLHGRQWRPLLLAYIGVRDQ